MAQSPKTATHLSNEINNKSPKTKSPQEINKQKKENPTKISNIRAANEYVKPPAPTAPPVPLAPLAPTAPAPPRKIDISSLQAKIAQSIVPKMNSHLVEETSVQALRGPHAIPEPTNSGPGAKSNPPALKPKSFPVQTTKPITQGPGVKSLQAPNPKTPEAKPIQQAPGAKSVPLPGPKPSPKTQQGKYSNSKPSSKTERAQSFNDKAQTLPVLCPPRPVYCPKNHILKPANFDLEWTCNRLSSHLDVHATPSHACAVCSYALCAECYDYLKTRSEEKRRASSGEGAVALGIQSSGPRLMRSTSLSAEDEHSLRKAFKKKSEPNSLYESIDDLDECDEDDGKKFDEDDTDDKTDEDPYLHPIIVETLTSKLNQNKGREEDETFRETIDEINDSLTQATKRLNLLSDLEVKRRSREALLQQQLQEERQRQHHRDDDEITRLRAAAAKAKELEAENRDLKQRLRQAENSASDSAARVSKLQQQLESAKKTEQSSKDAASQLDRKEMIISSLLARQKELEEKLNIRVES